MHGLKYYKFSYDGPVKEFDMIVSSRWQGETYAPTEKKARNNLAFRFKKQFNKTADCKITLPGKIKCEE